MGLYCKRNDKRMVNKIAPTDAPTSNARTAGVVDSYASIVNIKSNKSSRFDIRKRINYSLNDIITKYTF